MTRKDYVLLAVSFRRMVQRALEARASADVRRGVVLTIEHIAAELAGDSPRFDAHQFRHDCDIGRGAAIREGI